MSCCPHPVERHAFQGCANCSCCVTWVDHPNRERDKSPEGLSTLKWRNAMVSVTLPDGGVDQMPRWRANSLGLQERP